MKRFLMFILLAISVVSIGLTIYYFSVDNEVIYIKSSYLVVEVGDVVPTNGLVEYRNKNNETTLSFGIQQDNNVLSVNENSGLYTALTGGESQIVITTTNRRYASLVINVLVCDGSKEYPYIIKDEESLLQIGQSEKYDTTKSFKLGADIIFSDNTASNWTPLASYSGTFDGNRHTISNIVITDATIGSLSEVGFFSSITETGVVKNLRLDNIQITASNAIYMGAVAGKSEGKIQNTQATGELSNASSLESYTGGIVGYLRYNTIKPIVDRCSFVGEIETSDSDTTLQTNGGVVGWNYMGRVSESFFRTSVGRYVKNNMSNFGGVVGKNEGAEEVAEVYDCYFYLGSSLALQTNEAKIGWIIHHDTSTSIKPNIVIGNYFTGLVPENLKNQYIFTSDNLDVVKPTLNKFLSSVDFTNKLSFKTVIATDYTRYWDFDTVWTMSGEYPIISERSVVGSTYLINIGELPTAEIITTPQQFYDAVSGVTVVPNNAFIVVGELVNGRYVIDFSAFEWGDNSHPIPATFAGTIVCENGCILKNLTIKNVSTTNNVGLVKELSKNAVISGLSFENVRIYGERGRSVGVLAGVNKGANVGSISVKTVSVEIAGNAFGSVFGKAERGEITSGLSRVTVQNVDLKGNYFVVAGGVVGINESIITAERARYSSVRSVKLHAKYLGGVAGVNYGKIEYITARDITLTKSLSDYALLEGQDGILDARALYFGGIAGLNTSEIYNVYASPNFSVESAVNYKIYMGGVAGIAESIDGDTSIISRAYVYSAYLQVRGVYASRMGGIAGYHFGTISNCVVDNDSKITSDIRITDVGTALDISKHSVVGGLVGYEAASTNSSASIYESISSANTIKGFYAGGLVGISNGKIIKSTAGVIEDYQRQMRVEGFIAGGLASIISGGYVKDSIAIAKLVSANFNANNTYRDLSSIFNLEVSATAGLAVMVTNSAVLGGSYCVVEFTGPGVNYAICADTSGYKNSGIITGNIFTNQPAGANTANFGTKLTTLELKGTAASGGVFAKFQSNIGSENFGETWQLTQGKYPKIYNLVENCPNASGIE